MQNEKKTKPFCCEKLNQATITQETRERFFWKEKKKNSMNRKKDFMSRKRIPWAGAEEKNSFSFGVRKENLFFL